MRESDRKLQWCPHRRTTLTIDPPGPPAINITVAGNAVTVGPDQVEIGTCIGSVCSQWRWEGPPYLKIVKPPDGDAQSLVRGADGELQRLEPAVRPPGVDASFTWSLLLSRWFKLFGPGDRPGHCGLSGAAPYD